VRKPRTDYGTIVLHWVLVASFCVALVSGLRIAMEEPGHAWLTLLDSILPSTQVWTAHIPAAVVLVTVALAYSIYMMRTGLWRRIRVDAARLRGLFSRGPARWGAVNVVLYWTFFGALSLQVATGALLYFGWRADSRVAGLHWYCTWIMLCYAILHILVHTALGGREQLLRIFRPGPIIKPPPPLDPVELLMLLAERDQKTPLRHGSGATGPPQSGARAPPPVG
jgi:hypothetical protein